MRLTLAVSLFVLLPAMAQAHAIGLDCTLRGDKVEVEVYYDDDSPASKAKVEVVNANDKIIANGITDANGRWAFATPAPGKYEVRVDGGAGHRAKKNITIPGAPADDHGNAPEVSITEAATRAEFTSVPWLKIIIGLVVIGACTSAFVVVALLRGSARRAP